VWLPDLKFHNKKCASRLGRIPWYFETVAGFIKELHDYGEDFSIRHLIMPNHLDCCTYPILDWMADNIPRALINLMDQYHPDSFTNPATSNYNSRYQDINRRLTKNEINNVMKKADHKNINYEIITYN
jgi:putative pyruvate formate lyase activating enzyme